MNISYDYYRTFYFVAKHKSFTAAAEELFAGQPNVTRTVRILEEQLGCALFVRTKRKVELTPEGEKLFQHVRIAIEHLIRGEEELMREKNLQRGAVTVGASETALYGLLLPVLKNFRARFPEIQLRIGNYTTKQALRALREGFVDFAVVTTPLEQAEEFTAKPLLSFRETAVCGQNFSELAARPVSFKRLTELPMVGLARSTKTYEFYTELFAKHDLLYRPEVEVATADQILPMIENNLGVGFLPEFFLKAESRTLPVLLEEPLPERTICLVKATDRPLSIAAQRLEQEILQSPFCPILP
ncbi:MAG: LysR family transcriptional regulator [Clostridia bacterium]|nr:LysR family transcriptional regulator [Clostridia bacterium]